MAGQHPKPTAKNKSAEKLEYCFTDACSSRDVISVSVMAKALKLRSATRENKPVNPLEVV